MIASVCNVNSDIKGFFSYMYAVMFILFVAVM